MNIFSCITLSADAPKLGLNKLPSPENVECVTAIPEETTALERRYLEALQKNVRARREYNVLLREPVQQPTGPHLSHAKTRLPEHMGLLRLKRRHQELQILQGFMTKLKDTPITTPEHLNLGELQKDLRNPAWSGYQHPNRGVDQARNNVDALVRQLEIALLRAQYHVDRERRLLAKVEEDVVAAPAAMRERNKSRALAAARDELVAWIEDKLPHTAPDGLSIVDKEPQEQEPGSPISNLHNEIMDKYNRYINLRKEMLGLISGLSTKTHYPIGEVRPPEKSRETSVQSFCPTGPPLLPFILSQIHQPTQRHRFYCHQTSYLSAVIDKEYGKTTSELRRLADESHLLPAYPVLAQQDRYKHVPVPTAPKPIDRDSRLGSEESEMSKMLKAWAFAADAATEALEEIAKTRSERGHEAVDEGERWVKKMRELVGDDRRCEEEVSMNEDGVAGEEDEDVWAIEAGVGPLGRRKPRVKGTEDHWGGLQGQVGLREEEIRIT